MAFSHGEWVKFSLEGLAENPKMHVLETEEGKFGVGIYQRGGVDGTGEAYPESVIPVAKNGNNIKVLNDQDELVLIQFKPQGLKNLRKIESVEELPLERQKTTYKGWKPRK